jgi:hypothetical protein
MNLPSDRIRLTNPPWTVAAGQLFIALFIGILFWTLLSKAVWVFLSVAGVLWTLQGLVCLFRRRLFRDSENLYVVRAWQETAIPVDQITQMYQYSRLFSDSNHRRWKIRYLDVGGKRRQFSVRRPFKNEPMLALEKEVLDRTVKTAPVHSSSGPVVLSDPYWRQMIRPILFGVLFLVSLFACLTHIGDGIGYILVLLFGGTLYLLGWPVTVERDDQFLYVTRLGKKQVVPLDRIFQCCVRHAYGSPKSNGGAIVWVWWVRYLDEDGTSAQLSFRKPLNSGMERLAWELKAKNPRVRTNYEPGVDDDWWKGFS